LLGAIVTCTLLLPSAAKAFTLVRIVPDRAIIYYDKQLCALEPETPLSIDRINGKLPEDVVLLQLGGSGWRPKLKTRDDENLYAYPVIGPTLPVRYLSVSRDNRIVLILGRKNDLGKREDLSIWKEHLVSSKRFGSVNPEEQQRIFLIECVAESSKGRYIVVSNQTIRIKDRQGDGLTLYPLVLGNKNDAAKFERVDDLRK
jgi:hypothetical protein